MNVSLPCDKIYLMKHIVSRLSGSWFLSKYFLYYSCCFQRIHYIFIFLDYSWKYVSVVLVFIMCFRFLPGYFSLMCFLNKAFLTNIDWWIAAVIHSFVFNFKLYLSIFVKQFIHIQKKIIKEMINIIFSTLTIRFHSFSE